MTPGADRIAGLMALVRDLQEVMRAEAALLDTMRLRDFQALQLEKADLAAALDAQLRRFRSDPSQAAALDVAQRASLETALREFQAMAAAHARRLAAARSVVEGILRELARGPVAERTGSAYGTMAGVRPSTAQVVPLALDRQL
ncbi:MAG: hypothetical protein U1E45_18150 [Geminicoccaceae bacterium]